MKQLARSFRGLAAAAMLLLPAQQAAAGTLDTVKARGSLNCGVSTGLLGFSDKDAKGDWVGFDVDFCRALAGALFNDRSKVEFTPLSASERFAALKAGTVDVLSRNSTWTIEREANLGLLFAGINFHDGQGFMVVGRPEITSALEMTGLRVCVQSGTTSQNNLADFFAANSMTLQEKAFPTSGEALRALDAGECDALTSDQSALFAERLKLTNPRSAVILPDVISKEPLGPVVRSDDVAWFNAVKWVNFALINAEELGINAGNVDQALASKKPEVRRFVGAEGAFGDALGLRGDWALAAIKGGGNYAEIYERNVGTGSRLAIPRGLNQLWSMGGILYAPPIR